MKEVRSKGRKNKLTRYVPAEDEEYESPLGVLCDEPTEKDFAYIEAFARIFPEAAYDLYTCYNEGIVAERDERNASSGEGRLFPRGNRTRNALRERLRRSGKYA